MCIFVADMQHIVIRFILSVCLFLPLNALADNTGERLLDEADSLYALQQYDAALPYIEDRRLDPWTHNRTIQKAVESFRVTEEHKEYLRSLR